MRCFLVSHSRASRAHPRFRASLPASRRKRGRGEGILELALLPDGSSPTRPTHGTPRALQCTFYPLCGSFRVWILIAGSG